METVDLPLESRDYGSKVATVEPGGVEFIPLEERHGTPVQLLWTWASPNFEFATVFVGVIGTLFFGLSSRRRPRDRPRDPAGLAHPRLPLHDGARAPACPRWWRSARRSASGATRCPAGINAVMAGIGWFAVNSVSGAFALNALTDLPGLCLLIVVATQVVVAFSATTWSTSSSATRSRCSA